MALQAYKKRTADLSPRQGEATEQNPLAGGMPSLVDGASRKDLPEAMRTKMENAFGADFSNLNIYESEKVAEGGAKAVTQGNTIAFAPGEFNVYSPSSEALLGHELSHVVSQARGESRGSGLVDNAYLEAKADREGVMAAAGQQVYNGPLTPLSSSSPMSVAGPMQCKKTQSEASEADQASSIYNSQIRMGADTELYNNVIPDEKKTNGDKKRIQTLAGKMNDFSNTDYDYQERTKQQMTNAASTLLQNYSRNIEKYGSDAALEKTAYSDDAMYFGGLDMFGQKIGVSGTDEEFQDINNVRDILNGYQNTIASDPKKMKKYNEQKAKYAKKRMNIMKSKPLFSKTSLFDNTMSIPWYSPDDFDD